MTAKKSPTLTKNPINGGKPAIENNITVKLIAKPEFDLYNKITSVKSLFCFLKKTFFIKVSIKISQKQIEDSI